MAFFRKKSKIEKFLEVVSQERCALINGDIDALIELSVQKEKSLEYLLEFRSEIAKSELTDVARICSDVQILYSPVQAGLNAAHKRLRTLQKPNFSLETYDATGASGRASSTSQDECF